MKIDKNSKVTYIFLMLFYTTFVAVVASSITTKLFLNEHFNSEKFSDAVSKAMYDKYLEEIQIKNREHILEAIKYKNQELEIYRQSVINRLNLIDSVDRKIYLLKDLQEELEAKRANSQKD